jgi:hypothetical protein
MFGDTLFYSPLSANDSFYRLRVFNVEINVQSMQRTTVENYGVIK